MPPQMQKAHESIQGLPPALPVPFRTEGPKSRHPEHDDVFFHRPQVRIIEAKLPHHRRAEVFQNHVAEFDQTLDQLRSLRMLEINRDGERVAIVLEKARRRMARPEAPESVGGERGFNLNDLCAMG